MIKDKLDYALMITRLNEATAAYDAGEPIMSDEAWDNLYFEVKEFEQKTGIVFRNSPTQTIYYEVVNELKKVEHNHPMLSLAKTKDWDEFLRYFSGRDVIGMTKLDGLTCSLEYQNGLLIKAETRGNGEIGEDILHNAKVIPSIPKHIDYYETLIVDGEIICTASDFEPFSEEYKNPRNFASGSIRLLDSEECSKRHLTFVVWNIVEGFNEENSFLDKIHRIEALGFNSVPWTSSFDWDAREFLVNQAKKLGYPIDGLVGRFDDISYGNSLGATSHHSRAAYAFKFYDEEYETTLKDIEWTMGRTGVLTPVAVFEPIDDGESIVERASLHNVSIMYQLLARPFYGQEVKVIKANQIIPQIVWGGDGDGTPFIIPKICPICGGKTEIVISDSGTQQLKCNNFNCQGQLINKLEHFCSKKGLDIKGLSKATLEKLIDFGWVSSITDLYSLKNHLKEWVQVPGFGPKSVSNILGAIEKSKECELTSFISALGIPLIGNSYAKVIADKEETWDEFRKDVTNNFNFASWDGFGYELSNSLLSFDYSEADWLVENMLSIATYNKPTAEEQPLKDKVIVITGKLVHYKNRTELQNVIESCGGRVAGSVSKNTSFLINNDKESSSSKNVSAQKLGVPILTEQEFLDKFF